MQEHKVSNLGVGLGQKPMTFGSEYILNALLQYRFQGFQIKTYF